MHEVEVGAHPRHNAPPMDLRERRAGIVRADKRFVWSLYTPMDRYIEATDPLVIDRAEGALLFDADGKSYIDASSSWASTLGHNHPRLVRALVAQAGRLCHTSLAGITHEAAARLAEEMIAIAPAGLSRVFFSDAASTAVESAIKMAAQAWQNLGRPGKSASSRSTAPSTARPSAPRASAGFRCSGVRSRGCCSSACGLRSPG